METTSHYIAKLFNSVPAEEILATLLIAAQREHDAAELWRMLSPLHGNTPPALRPASRRYQSCSDSIKVVTKKLEVPCSPNKRYRRNRIGSSKEEPYRLPSLTSINREDFRGSKDDLFALCSSTVNSQSSNFVKMMEEPPFFIAFRTFLEKELSEESLDFWKDVKVFKADHPTLSYSEVFARGFEIYNEYLSPDAPRQINISSFERKEISKTFALSHPTSLDNVNLASIVQPTIFDSMAKNITRLLRVEHFPLFKIDPLFEEASRLNMKVKSISFSHSLKESRPVQLKQSDWDILVSRCTPVAFEKGDVIIKQAIIEVDLYILQKGSISFQLSELGQDFQTITTIDTPVLFGVHSIFRSSLRSPFQIIAETKVQLLRLNLPFILRLFKVDASLSFRFFASIAVALSEFNMKINTKKLSVLQSLVKPSFRVRKNHPLSDLLPCLSNSILMREDVLVLDKKSRTTEATCLLSTDSLFIMRVVQGDYVLKEINSSHIKSVSVIQGTADVDIRSKHKAIKLRFQEKKLAHRCCGFLATLLCTDILIPCDDNKLVEHTMNVIPVITQNVWDVIESGGHAAISLFSKGDKIIEQSTLYAMTIIILQGPIRVTHKRGSTIQNVDLEITMEEIFGSHSLLCGNPAPESITATGNVQVLMVKNSYLTSSFLDKHPAEATSFYFHLCRCLANRIARKINIRYRV